MESKKNDIESKKKKSEKKLDSKQDKKTKKEKKSKKENLESSLDSNIESNNKIGVLLLNMGGPTDIYSVESFLKNLFADPLILQIKNGFIRKMVASMIVNKRLEISKENYRKIGGGSPIIKHTFALTEVLNKLDSTKFYSYTMRYTPPNAYSTLQECKQKGINDLVLFSMYPQYSTTTTLSSFNDIYNNLKQLDYKPRVSTIAHYYLDLDFYKLILDSIYKTLGDKESKDFTLLLSAHSLPQSIIDKGDPYLEHCQKGLEIIKDLTKDRPFKDVILCFQSKIGKQKWLEPSTTKVLADLAKKRESNVVVYPLAFSIDNSETDFELKIEYKELADKLGFKNYLVSPCLNDSEDFARFIINKVNEKLRSIN